MSFWTQPINLRWLVVLDDDSGVPSRSLSIHSCARRGSRSGSELPPFVPCTAPRGCQVPQSGTRCHRFTSWVGIAPTRWLSCQEPKLLRLLPESLRIQLIANGSHQVTILTSIIGAFANKFSNGWTDHDDACASSRRARD